MNVAQTLPLPNPGDWLHFTAAAHMLKTSSRTVQRMIDDGRLKSYPLIGAPANIGYRLLWRADVEAMADALEKVRKHEQ